ncbi:MAG: cytosine permease, partial [Gemmatimonadales bacterium]
MTQVARADLVELVEPPAPGPLLNADLAPTPLAARTWGRWHIASLWVGLSVCIPTYMLSASMIQAGITWWQSLLVIFAGNAIVLVPMIINAHAGTRYGIPFPVYARAAYGPRGAHLPSLLRAVVACGWFGIQAWIGGEALHTLFTSLIPAWPTALGAGFGGHTTTEWLSFLLFWGINVFIIYKGMDVLRMVENWAAPFVL